MASQVVELVRLPDETAAWPRRVPLFGVAMDAVTMQEATAIVAGWLAEPFARCRYVVTPNVDHVVILQQHAGLRAAYADAGLVLADGWPVVAASRILGRRLPERVAGSDFVPTLFRAIPAENPVRTFLLGAGPGVAERARERIHAQWPGVHVVGVANPPFGFESSSDENQRILSQLAESEPDLLIVGLGAPKQELWVHAHRDQLEVKAAICAGATIDFLAEAKQRAPLWMRRTGLEWLHRLIGEPRRMVARYGRDAWTFPQLVWEEWRGRPSSERDDFLDSIHGQLDPEDHFGANSMGSPADAADRVDSDTSACARTP